MSCPICSKPTMAATRPFCSNRCKDVDLARWLNESYRAPAQDEEDPSEAEIEPHALRPH